VTWIGGDGINAGERIRKTIGGWRNTDINGELLRVNTLSTRLTKVAGYRRTICKIEAQDYLLRRINGEVEPLVAESMKGMETSLRNAHFWGADTVLLVPAVVNPQTCYRDAWVRSQQQIRRLLPMAQELKVIIAVEEVWNKFLLSPLEFASYVDSFKSPTIRAYFDVGNVVISGYPQDWIRTLGPRIAKLHIKDFKYAKRQAEFVPLREGEIDWLEVYKALGEIGYKGTATVELPGGDKDYLREVSRCFDLILSGA